MIRNANSLDNDATLTADICIIGAGAAGITLARELAGTGRRVILLEGGADGHEGRHQELYSGRMSGVGTWKLDVMRARRFGGSTNLWAGWCRPFRPEDFEARAWMPDSGWPITYDDVLPYYRRAAEIIQIGPFTWDAAAVAEADGHALLFPPDSDITTEMFQYSPPTRFAATYRADLERGEGLDVLLEASVVEIRLSEDGRRAESVRCATLDGVSFSVRAERFVLAAGGIETPRLLLASSAQAAEGVANGAGQVGRWWMEHPHYLRVVGIVTPRPLDLAFYRRHTTTLSVDGGPDVETSIQGVFSLAKSVREAEQIMDWTCSIREYDIDDSGLDLDPRSVVALASPGDDPRYYKLTARVEQTPNRDSRITLMDERDALGMPRADLNWQIHDRDKERMRRALDIFGAELALRGLGRVWVPTEEDGRLAWGPGPGGHHMGGARMGDDPATSVVNADCACHEVPNLYIAGSSVFATGASANPTFTIVALALRLADHLKEQD